jgi:hypothetical protein
MMHGHLYDPEAGIVDLLHHLETDHAARFLQLDLVEDRSPHQPEVAVDVAHLQAEHDRHDMVVEAADHDSVQRIRAIDLVAVHEMRLGREPDPQIGELRGVVLPVSVGVEDELFRSGAKPGLKGAAVSAVHRMVHDPDAGIPPGELVGDRPGRVGASIVDHDDFVVRRECGGRLDRANHHAGDRRAVVQGGKEHAEPWRPGRALDVHAGDGDPRVLCGRRAGRRLASLGVRRRA